MNNRILWGVIISIIGLVLVFIPAFINDKSGLTLWIYGIPLFAIGIIIILNKKEDKIEEINYNGGTKK